MGMPSVVIVGRPNVGKSSLFNALCGRRIAIVDPSYGVTRDRIAAEVCHDGRSFEVVDTGGIGLHSASQLAEDIEMQITVALEQADLILFVVDVRDGVQPLDRDIASRLRQTGKQVLLVANKCDSPQQDEQALEFFALGFGQPAVASAAHRRGLSALLDELVALLPEGREEGPEAEPMKIAFVGRRNVGKSTLINYLAREPRVIVSEMPGTTRDAVDVRFRVGDNEFIAIDTAGLRKRKQIKDSVDFYSFARARSSIRRADVVVHMMDAPGVVSRVDKKLAAEVVGGHKPCVLAMNKMDLAQGVPCERFAEYVHQNLPGMWFAPVVCISALSGDGVLGLLEEVCSLYEQSFVRVPTAKLNEALERIEARRHPPSRGSRPGKILYGAQTAVAPPTIVLFTNYSAVINEGYERYLANQLRAEFEFHSIPIKFLVRARKRGRRRESPPSEGPS